MTKPILGIIKLYLPAGQANPAPPVGPALSKYGVNIVKFCETFNGQTKNLPPGLTIPALITVYKDKSFSIQLKSPPTSVLLKQACQIAKGSGEPNRTKVGKITRKQLEEIAKKKMEDLNATSLESAIKIIEGSARSMGIVVEE